MSAKFPKSDIYKAVIIIGGPQKGTRFRPLSFDKPKPLFPVAGVPMIQHLIEECCKVTNLKEILLIGYYQGEEINKFVTNMNNTYHSLYNVNIRYLQEFTSLGTAGGIYHFRDQIQSSDPEAFFLIHGDVCGDFPLTDMIKFHKYEKDGSKKNSLITVLGTDATRLQSRQYGCIVENFSNHEIIHYVEKPSSFVSNTINCGVYLCSKDIFLHLEKVFKQRQSEESVDSYSNVKETIGMENDLLMPLAGFGKLFVYCTTGWWSQIKTAGSAIYANRHYLDVYHESHPDWLAKGGNIIGDVFIHSTARVHKTSILGPNVSIGKNVIVGKGVRIKDSIILGNSKIHDNAYIVNSIIGWNSKVGSWSRVEGTPCDPNPNKPFAKIDNVGLFNENGQLNPSITVLGSHVLVPPEVMVLNSIILPHKELTQSYKNEIIL